MTRERIVGPTRGFDPEAITGLPTEQELNQMPEEALRDRHADLMAKLTTLTELATDYRERMRLIESSLKPTEAEITALRQELDLVVNALIGKGTF